MSIKIIQIRIFTLLVVSLISLQDSYASEDFEDPNANFKNQNIQLTVEMQNNKILPNVPLLQKDADLKIPREFLVNEIKFFSKDLKLVDAVFCGEKQSLKNKSKAESGEMESFAVEAGDVRKGILLILESNRRPYRYHSQVFAFDEKTYWAQNKLYSSTQNPPVLGLADTPLNDQLRLFCKTPQGLDINIEQAFITKTVPNKLMIVAAEVDTRCPLDCLGYLSDVVGRAKSWFERDPIGAITTIVKTARSLVVGI